MAAPRLDGKGAFPVLVYLASKEPLSLSGSMFIHTVPRRNDVATITLSIPLLLDSSEPEQTFLLQYDPDNITSATDAQGTADHHVPLGRLPTESDPPLHTLSLHLRDPCVVWSPCQQPKAPKSGSATAYEELVELVKAMAVHIVFDYRKLRHPRLQQCYRLFVDEPKKLTAFDFLQLSDKGFFRYDWRTFAPADSAPTANSAPPAYAETLDKRSRPGPDSRPSSSSSQPLSKKPREDPSQEPPRSDTTVAYDHGYREHQGAIEDPYRELTQSDTEIASNNSQFDLQHNKVAEDDLQQNEVAKDGDFGQYLYGTPKPSAPASITANITSPLALSTEEVVRKVVKAEVVSAVKELLPPVLKDLFPTLAFTVAGNTANSATANHSLTNLQQVEALVLPYILARLQEFPHLQSIDDYISEAHDEEERRRSAAETDFDEVVENCKAELEILSKDKQADLEKEAAYQLDEVRHAMISELNELHSDARNMSAGVSGEIDTLVLKSVSDINRTAWKAKKRVKAKTEALISSASEHIEQMRTKRLRDTEAALDKMIALKTRAWRRRVFLHGTSRRKRRGLLGRGASKSKIRKPDPKQSVELPTDEESTTEDEA